LQIEKAWQNAMDVITTIAMSGEQIEGTSLSKQK
jgi:hypothetical protein